MHGVPLRAPSAAAAPGARGARGGAYISAAFCRRGGRVIIAAALAGVADTDAAGGVERLLSQEIQPHGELLRGQLPNGLQYVLLPNKTPPARFEAHLEMHVGSVDERTDEQGVAHLVEHVTFLGSKKRESLLGTGARANAYTDFHHTVFHVHAPLVNGITGAPMLPQARARAREGAVLEALSEIAFAPQFLPTRVEKERKAVLAEAQMMNTIEYRVDCQLLQYLHEENNLGYRFPIGKTEQVKRWPQDLVHAFWRRWYFPANATLYVVQQLIEKEFGRILPGMLDNGEAAAPPAADAGHDAPAHGAANGNGGAGAMAAVPVSAAALHLQSRGSPPLPPAVAPLADDAPPAAEAAEEAAAGEPPLVKVRHPVRPPVAHKHGYGPLAPGEGPAPVSVFRHPLLQSFMLSVFCKLPVTSMTTMDDLRKVFMVRILLSAFTFRVNARYVDASPRFSEIGLDISDSGREGCAVSTLTITSEPKDWRGAIKVAVEEVRRMQRFGITKGELERWRQAMLRDSAQLAEQANSIPHINSLDFVMESLALGHTVMEHREAHDAMLAVADTITPDDVNAVARSFLSFASDFGAERDVLERAAGEPGLWAEPGPSRATSIVACIPEFMDASGSSAAPGGGAMSRGANMGAGGHLDADSIDLAELEAHSKDLEEFEVPEGAMRFELTAEQIAEALADPTLEVDPLEDVDMPDRLVSPERLEALLAAQQPRYVPLDGPGAAPGDALPPTDAATGITQRRLSNGIRINYRHTDNEPKSGMLRLVMAGGRAVEPSEAGPSGASCIGVGTRALSESGTAGGWQRQQMEVFCISNLVNSVMEADEEFIVLDVHFAVTDGSMEAMFEMLHEFLTAPSWEDAALERAKQVFVSSYRTTAKSLERATADRIMTAMLGGDRRFRDPLPDEVEALTLEGVRDAVMQQLHAGNIEVNIVGDFESGELEQLCLAYLGTVAPREGAGTPPDRPVTFPSEVPAESRHQTWHLRDSDERACAYIAGQAPCRWGDFGSRGPLPPLDGPIVPPPALPPRPAPAEVAAAREQRRRHPLYASISLELLKEVINSRLFTTVRDSLGLTYDVSFEVMMFDRVRTGWFSVNVTSYPDKIHDALAASLAVLRELRGSPVTARELMRAKRTLITRHESDLKDNVYWLGLLTHLQSPGVPYKRVECLRDLRAMYEAANVDDIYEAYDCLAIGEGEVFTCVGTSGKSPPPAPDAARLAAMYGAAPPAAAPGPLPADVAAAVAAGLSKLFGGQPPAGGGGGGAQAAAAGGQQQQQQQQGGQPLAVLTAMLAAAQSAKSLKALQNQNGAGAGAGAAKQQEGGQQQPGGDPHA
ncbi:MAG: LuxS/MPP-like metallohydrolase [Monoraphidium minutum]|nr:MAG: LuxS/MPP-like metallohydrolase [Monoraphidium minutum]